MKSEILIFLCLIIFISAKTGDISDFDKFPEAQKIIKTYLEDYKSKFGKIFKDGPIYSGDGTAYGDSTNGGNCLFPKKEYYADMMYAAINHDQYVDDLGCGACALVVCTSNPYKPIRVRIIDQCPECEHGSLDFSDIAFKAVTNMHPNRVKISWALIPCDIDIPDYPALVEPNSDIKFQFKVGSSVFWFQVQVFNTKYPVAEVEVETKDGFAKCTRVLHNYWTSPSGEATPPFTFRVTLADSTVIVAKNVELVIPSTDDEGEEFSSGTQTVTSK